MQGIWDKIYGYIIQYGVGFISALLIFFIGKWAARLISKLIENIMVKSKLEKTLVSFVKNIAYYGMLIFVAIAALNKIGVQTSSFVALIGAAGLAVGLALQGTLSNFAAGVMLIIFEPFKMGDSIEAGGAAGLVEEIQIFNTIIISSDNKRIIVPNSKITADKISILPKK